MRLLLLEDNQRCGDLIREHLRDAGYLVDLSATISDFRTMVAAQGHDLYILDLGLPDGDAMDLIRDLRLQQNRVPILVTSGRSQVCDRIAGLENGADDYLVKPFHCDELTARVRALLRRPPAIEARRLTVGLLDLDSASGEISLAGERLDLSPSERRLLTVLMKRHNQVVPKPALERLLYEAEATSTPNAIEKLVSRLRKRLGSAMGVEVKTVHGDGYLLVELP